MDDSVNKRRASDVSTAPGQGGTRARTVSPSAGNPRRIYRDAKHRDRDTRKLLRRARKTLAEKHAAKVRDALDAMNSARRDKDASACQSAVEQLEPLVDTHLARYRKSAFREYSESIGLAVLFALMLRAFVVEAFQIPSESMVPTLLVGDHLFVNKFVYGVRIPFTRYDVIDFGHPRYGDVVVFIFPVEEVRTQVMLRTIMRRLEEARRASVDQAYPEDLAAIGMGSEEDGWGSRYRFERTNARAYALRSAGPDETFETPDDITNENTALRPLRLGERNCITPENEAEAKDYIKRVIGLPGDRVRVQDSVVYVNDVALQSRPHPGGAHVQADRFGRAPMLRIERHEDAEYVVQHHGALADFDEVVVREGYLFVMGDNRDNSSDSRCWGQVPIDNVKGEAMFLFWSGGDGGGFLGNRWGRMLNTVE